MGAFVKGDTIYIDKNLSETMTKRERKVLLAHELSHWLHHDNRFCAISSVVFFWCPPLVKAIRRFMEERADRYALFRTKDKEAFISLMNKLEHSDNTHPSKERRLKIAQEAFPI